MARTGGPTDDEIGAPITAVCSALADAIERQSDGSLVSLLPATLNLRGKPYTLDDHYPFAPMFRREIPPIILWRCGRQVSKTTSMAASRVIISGAMDYFNSLSVTPLSEQSRRYSKEYVRPFLSDSPISDFLVANRADRSVLEIQLRNRSTMFFSYCLRDADRVRGISSDCVTLDEVQDIDWDLVPIILETMSYSKWAFVQMAGTPKTTTATIERIWERSSKAEWVTRCQACNYYNIAALAHDIIGMIGRDTVVCAKCKRPINPRALQHPDPLMRGTGFWVHARPTLEKDRPGYHAPQIIFPMHFENRRKWHRLVEKMDPAVMPRNVFINEVLGEAADAGTLLLTQADLIRACQIYGRPNRFLEALRNKDNYMDVAVGVDWGGSTSPYGSSRAKSITDFRDRQSFTALAVVGMRPGGSLDVLYAYRFDIFGNLSEESYACMNAWRDVDAGRGSTLFCHDYGGVGSVREMLMIHAGLPIQAIFGCAYVHAPRHKVVELKTDAGRVYYQVDKARSLLNLCQAAKLGFVGLPTWETAENTLRDFLALTEDVIERPGAANIIRIVRKPGMPDDVAHAVNFAAVGLWHRHGFPNFGETLMFRRIEERLRASADAVDRDEALNENE